MGYLKQAAIVWLATLAAYCLAFLIARKRDRNASTPPTLPAAIAGTLAVYGVLLAVPSTLYLILLVGLSALLGSIAIVYVPLILLAAIAGAWGTWAALDKMPSRAGDGLTRHLALFFSLMTLCWSLSSPPFLLKAYHA